ncbi:MAG: uvrD [Chloroflexi bacterium]|nr:uvrD [Chloroflexota bacterium]
MQHLDGLNPAQLEAVETVSGPLMIVAGPGSGKTRVIVHRIANLILSERVAPWNILAVTFTNKAAREMRERLDGLLGRSAQSLNVGTFHSQCARILRVDGPSANIDPRFVIFDDGDQIDLVKRILKEMEIDDKRSPARSFLSAISAAKSELIGPRQYSEFAQGYWQERVGAVYPRYQEGLTKNRALDFDDLIGETVRLFREAPEILDKYQERFKYIMVDEFQDTNVAQYRLVKLLAQKYRNVCVVGDEDQSVYSWRMADVRNIGYFETDFPELKIVLLEQNYRSTQTILNVARSVIDANEQRKAKQLWTENDAGNPVVLHEAYNEQDEAQFVIREIERLTRTQRNRYADFAVMYRTNAQSRPLEDAFVRFAVPYRLIGGTRFYERKEVKDVLAYLRLAQNPADALSLARVLNVPARGIGEKTVTEVQRWGGARGLSFMESLEAIADGRDADDNPVVQGRGRTAVRGFVDLVRMLARAAAEMTPIELLDLLLERSGYEAFVRNGTEEGESRWENILEVRTKAAEFNDFTPPLGLAALLEEVCLVQDVDNYDPEADGVTLITLHTAKGLEFPYVFIVGLEEGLCPHSRSLNDQSQMEEERRLIYVGITRAMSGLYLVNAQQRTLFGNFMNNQPSRFLADVPENLVSRPFGRTAHSPGRRDFARAGTGAARPRMWPGQPAFGVTPSPAALSHQTVSAPTPAAPARPLITEQQYAPGDHVFHPAFGTGVVVTSVLNRGDEEVTVAFEGKGVKKLSVAYAPLQRA